MCLKTDQTLMIVFLFNSIFFNDAFQQALHSGGPAGFDSFSVCQWSFEKEVFEKIDVFFSWISILIEHSSVSFIV